MANGKHNEMRAKDNSNSATADVDMTKLTKPPPSFYSTSVLANKSIFNRILQHLGPSDVFRCRLVNRKWNRLTTNYLRTEPSPQHQFRMAIEAESLQDDSYGIKLMGFWDYKIEVTFDGEYWRHFKPLSIFVEYIKSSKLDFLTDFRVMLNARAKGKDISVLLDFFSYYGSNIKTLELGFDRHDWSRNEDVSVCLNQLLIILPLVQSSVEKLALSNTMSESSFTLTNVPVPPIKFLGLKFLSANIWQLDETVFEFFFKAAVNLEEFNVQDGEVPLEQKCCQLFIDRNKLKVIKRAEIDLGDEDNFNIIKRLCLPRYSDLKLELLTVKYRDWRTDGNPDRLSSPNTASVLSTLLNSQKDNVQELKFECFLSNLVDLKLPIFQNLQILHLSIETKQLDEQEKLKPVFPKDFNFRQTFPNLVELHVDLNSETQKSGSESSARTIEEILFGRHKKQNQIKNIKKLFVSGYEESIWVVKQALLTFPALTFIHWSVKYISSLPKFFQKVFSLIPNQVLERIKSLEFKYLLVTNADSFPAFDATFTGFSKETCKSVLGLRPEFLRTLTDSQINELRENPSLLNFSSLKKLHLHIDGRNRVDEEDRSHSLWNDVVPDFMDNLMTDLTYVYCFRKIEGLEVKETITVSEDCYHISGYARDFYSDVFVDY